jgi:WD40 repeat protein
MIVGTTLVGHEQFFYYTSDGKRRENQWGPTIAYFPDEQKMLSGSSDKTARLWDLRAGKEIEGTRVVCEQEVNAVAVSSDGRWVVTAGGEVYPHDIPGELKVYEMKTGIVKRFEGHS